MTIRLMLCFITMDSMTPPPSVRTFLTCSGVYLRKTNLPSRSYFSRSHPKTDRSSYSFSLSSSNVRYMTFSPFFRPAIRKWKQKIVLPEPARPATRFAVASRKPPSVILSNSGIPVETRFNLVTFIDYPFLFFLIYSLLKCEQAAKHQVKALAYKEKYRNSHKQEYRDIAEAILLLAFHD